VVFTWGVCDEGRLGVPLHKGLEGETGGGGKYELKELTCMGPQLVKFPGNVIILKVCCGNSFSVALSEDMFVYSWGQGNSGGLGLGEEYQTETPKMI